MAACSLQIVAYVVLLVAQFDLISSSKTRYYFIAATEKDWNYAPTGLDTVKGVQLERSR